MKMRLMKKCLQATRTNRLLFPLIDAVTNGAPLDMDRDACIRVLSRAHADAGQSALWDKPLPPTGESAYRVDIIVPAYNAEATLAECMNSILAQETAYPFRVILVDDGSTDGTAALADMFAARENVLVLHQANTGVAGARNNGLMHGKAPYVMFMDADDRLAAGAVQRLTACAEESGADVVEGGYVNFKAGYRREHPHRAGDMPPMAAYGMPWGKVMRRELFTRAGFPQGCWFEDSVLHQLILPQAKRCVGVAETAVERRLVASSAGHISRGNPRSIDTVWVTLRLLRDREALGLPITQADYEYMLDMAALSHRRLEGLDETIRQAAFGVFDALIEEQYAGFTTEKKEKRALEAALRKRQYAKFARWCAWF